MPSKLLLHCCRMSRNQRAPQLMHQIRGSKTLGRAGSHQLNKQVHVKPDLGVQDWPGKQVLQVSKRLEKLQLPAAKLQCAISWSQRCTASFIEVTPGKGARGFGMQSVPIRRVSTSLPGSLPLSSNGSTDVCSRIVSAWQEVYPLLTSCVTSLHQTHFWRWGAHTA